MRIHFFLLSILCFLSVSCDLENSSPTFDIVYKNDKAGNTIHGSKTDLINKIRGGADIKIGWGSKGKSHTIEHLSTPIWLAIMDETEVIAHLDPQVLSQIDWENLSGGYADSTLVKQEWRVAITTKGEFDAVWIDRTTHKVTKRIPQRHTLT